jgi:hypothetical protein
LLLPRLVLTHHHHHRFHPSLLHQHLESRESFSQGPIYWKISADVIWGKKYEKAKRKRGKKKKKKEESGKKKEKR